MCRCSTLELLFIGLFLLKNSICSSDFRKPKIAIIGAGIGGASSSHFLTELFDGNLEIDVFESNKIGGRLATVDVGGTEYEAGGSLIDSRNKYMVDFVKLLGLENRPTSKKLITGIWNGNEFPMLESNWDTVTLMKLLYRYGLQPIKLYSHINSLLSNFETLYKNQENGIAYDDVRALISSMGPEISELLDVSTTGYFQFKGFSNAFIHETVEAILLSNFGQNTDTHSFLGCLSAAGAGASFWSVKGGNKKVPENLIHRNGKARLVPSQVKSIRHLLNNQSSTQYEISYSNPGSNDVTKNIYDIVVIAAPLTKDQSQSIEFVGLPNNIDIRTPGSYQTIIATFIQGDLNPSHFGLGKPVDQIFSCNLEKTKINSVTHLIPVNGETAENDSRVWKVFSEKSLTSNQISSMFSQVDQVQDITWKACPKYSANVRQDDKFELYDSLYHVNAIEWAASAMEMSAIAGRNVALLIHNKLSSCCRDETVADKERCGFSCKGEKVPHNKRKTEL